QSAQNEEEEDRQDRTGRQGDDPGQEDLADHAQVQRTDTASQADPKNGADQGVGGGYRQAQTRSTDHGGRSSQLGGKTTAGGQLGDFLADGGDDLVAIGSQTHDDAQRAQQQNPARHQRLLASGQLSATLDHADDGGQRTNGVGHIIGTVRKGHGAGGEDHQDGEYLLHAGEVESLVGFGIDMDAAEQEDTDEHDQHTDTDRANTALGAGRVQDDALEALGHGH